jgi:hypothetical protein
MLDVKHAASLALSSALTAWEHGYRPLPDTIQEPRVAHSRLIDGKAGLPTPRRTG